MSRWLPDFTQSNRVQLVIVAALSAGIAVSATIGLQQARRKNEVEELKESIPSFKEKHDVEKVSSTAQQQPHLTEKPD